jgi:hypothetical protein
MHENLRGLRQASGQAPSPCNSCNPFNLCNILVAASAALGSSVVRFYAVSLILCAGATLNASAVETTDKFADPSSRPAYQPWTVGAEFGSTGIGGFGSWRFSDHLGVRTGFDYFQWTENNLSIADFRYSVKARLMSEPLTLDIYPWQKHSFHVSVGMMFNQNQITGTSSGFGPVNLGGHTIEASDVGVLNLKIQQQVVDPYLSIGGNFLYFDHAHHWALGGELGVAYTGTPIMSLTSSGRFSGGGHDAIDAALGQEKAKAQDWANKFAWFPVIKLMVTYSF